MLTLLIVAKTRIQLNRRLADSAKLPWPPFGAAWYAGCTTLIIGNSLKAGIRTLPTICYILQEHVADMNQDLWRSINTSLCYKMPTGISPAQERSSQVLARGSRSHCWLLRRLRVSRPHCMLPLLSRYHSPNSVSSESTTESPPTHACEVSSTPFPS